MQFHPHAAPPPFGGDDLSAVEVQDGSHAIEVAAMFEDAVLDVRYFSHPNSGESTRWSVWGASRQRHFTIGPDADALFNVPGEALPDSSFSLVRSTGSAYQLQFTSQMSGDM